MGAHTVAGVDVGGTKITFALWAAGGVTYREVLPYTARSSGEFSDLVLKGIRDLEAHAAGQGFHIEGSASGAQAWSISSGACFSFLPTCLACEMCPSPKSSVPPRGFQHFWRTMQTARSSPSGCRNRARQAQCCAVHRWNRYRRRTDCRRAPVCRKARLRRRAWTHAHD